MPDWIVYLFLFALPILAIVAVSVFFVGYLVVSLTILTIRLIVFVIRLPPRLLIRLSRSAAAVFR